MGGTAVTWTNTGPVLDFPTAKHVFGFTVTAAGASNERRLLRRTVFYDSQNNASVDPSGTVAGPSVTIPAGAPVVSPAAFLLTMIELRGVGAWKSRRRWQGWLGKHA